MIDIIMNYLYIIPCALIAVVLHELSHGFISYLLGDPTPKEMGRLTINPTKHLDPIGIICLIFFGFGWAKPVMVNPTYYKKPKLGMTLVALAGPLMNFIIFLLSFVFIFLVLKIMVWTGLYNSLLIEIPLTFFKYLALINLGLCLFNLIPIPPLDGSKIIGCVLPKNAYEEYMSYQKYGMFFMMGLLLILNILESYGVESPLDLILYGIYDFFSELVIKLL